MMQEVVKKESLKAVQIFTIFNDWEQACKEINKKSKHLRDLVRI